MMEHEWKEPKEMSLTVKDRNSVGVKDGLDEGTTEAITVGRNDGNGIGSVDGKGLVNAVSYHLTWMLMEFTRDACVSIKVRLVDYVFSSLLLHFCNPIMKKIVVHVHFHFE